MERVASNNYHLNIIHAVQYEWKAFNVTYYIIPIGNKKPCTQFRAHILHASCTRDAAINLFRVNWMQTISGWEFRHIWTTMGKLQQQYLLFFSIAQITLPREFLSNGVALVIPLLVSCLNTVILEHWCSIRHQCALKKWMTLALISATTLKKS